MNATAQSLLDRIRNRDVTVGIIGLGYVGLPLALAFAERGFRVLGFDTDPEKVAKIGRGESYIKHLDADRLRRATGHDPTGPCHPEPRPPCHPEARRAEGSRESVSAAPTGSPGRVGELKTQNSKLRTCLLSATADFSRLDEPDAILICVPTPLTPQREPDMTYVRRAAFQVRNRLRPGQLVILESTTYPGTTDELLLSILESREDRRGPASSPDYGEARRAGPAADVATPGSGASEGSGFAPEPDTFHGWKPDLRGPAAPERDDSRSLGGTHSDEARSADGGDWPLEGDTRPGWSPATGLGRGDDASRRSPHASRTGLGELRTQNSELRTAPQLRCGRDFFLAFSPEREDPGNPTYGTTNTPKVVGGADRVSGDLAEALYAEVIDRTVRVSSARAAEAAKLVENIFRAVNIALVNELKIVYDRMGIDIWEVLDAAATKPFGFMRFNPGPGWGGHCIPLDPFYLSWKAREHGVATRFVELAGEINVRMPEYVIEKLTLALNERGKPVKGARVLVLGLAYKRDIDDPRESPAFEIIDRLLRLGAEVSYHDPHIPAAPTMRTWPDLPPMGSVALTAERLQGSDAVVIVTDHSSVDYELVAANAPLVIDTRGALRGRDHNVVKA